MTKRFLARLLVLLVLFGSLATLQAAFLTGVTWEQEEGSSNNDGGSFSPGVTGFATDGAATSGNTTAPVFTSASYNFVSGDVGAWVFIKSGTNWLPGFYKIASVASNAATLSAAAGVGVAYPNYRATLVLGVASTGSPTGATWGVDYSQQAAAQIAFTDMVTATTTFTSIAHPVGVNYIGNGVQIISGSGCTAGWHTVVSTSGTTGTLDSTGGTGTCTSNLGGAIGTLAQLNSVLGLTSNITQLGFVKANATYSIASGVTFNPTDNTKGTTIQVLGYTSVRGDNGQAHIQASAGSITMVTISNNNSLSNMKFANFILDCNSQTSTLGLNFTANGNSAANIKTSACSGTSYSLNSTFSTLCINCWAAGSTAAVAFNIGSAQDSSTNFCIYCFATGGTGPGFELSITATCNYCIAASNTGGSTDGFVVACGTASMGIMQNIVAYGNGRDGIRFNGDNSSGNCIMLLTNSVMYGKVGYGFNNTGTVGTSTSYGLIEDYNAFGNNTADTNNQLKGLHDVALSGNPFNNAGSLDFSLNNTSGAGAALKGVGFPGVLLTGGTGYLDIGALQHQLAATSVAIGFVGP